ncbi:diacylglycerol/lipid kinase family protein [Amycolatopsis sp. CA-230715]|uniref:diacylglycerol/lipid kinase family protein n=1 Tax=Amycolatopsis sp. CA-230715 TaxID=2745196 RepID=UPI001C017804|nr:YegS/Rv2252/BmrU family lipid kinase [Amycolatopsis sp. CA-230715]
MHAALAVHPDSGHGAAARVAGTVAARLRRVVDRLDLLVANSVEESRALMARAGGEGLDVLVVLGGDGAVHQGVQVCASTPVALGIVPSGTGNDFARALGVPEDPLAAVDEVVAALRAGARRRIDLGQVDGTWFATVLCAGFDALVSERANRLRWPSGPRRYDVAIIAELARFRARPVTLATETTRLDLDATLVAVGNTAWYGGGIPICPQADATDGLFDVTVVGDVGRADLVAMLPRLRTGRHLDHPAVRTLRAAAVCFGGDRLPVYADGERMGVMPLEVRCVAGALTVLTTHRMRDVGRV